MSKDNNRLTFWLIWLVGIVPMCAAFFMYYSGYLRPQHTVNQGQLLEQQTLQQWQLRDSENSFQHSGQWQILHTLPNGCLSLQCQNWQKSLPSLIKRLGKDSDRVVLYQVGNRGDMLKTAKLTTLGEAIWLADPLGNLVMRYSLDLEPKQLLADLKKLLKLSGIG
jgi:hypothetical protein